MSSEEEFYSSSEEEFEEEEPEEEPDVFKPGELLGLSEESEEGEPGEETESGEEEGEPGEETEEETSEEGEPEEETEGEISEEEGTEGEVSEASSSGEESLVLKTPPGRKKEESFTSREKASSKSKEPRGRIEKGVFILTFPGESKAMERFRNTIYRIVKDSKYVPKDRKETYLLMILDKLKYGVVYDNKTEKNIKKILKG
jgi:hypothetical protein